MTFRIDPAAHIADHVRPLVKSDAQGVEGTKLFHDPVATGFCIIFRHEY